MSRHAERFGRAVSQTVLVLLFVVVLAINLLPFVDSQDALMDFGSFYAAGLKAEKGENPYDPNSEYIFEINFERIGAGGKMVNLNPPISLLIFQVLPRFDPHRALLTWQIISALLYAGTVVVLRHHYKEHVSFPRVIWAFMLAGFWHTIILGQVYILLLVFAALGWIFLRQQRYLLAGVMIGLVICIKPNFGIWALFLLAAGFYGSALVSLLTALLVSLIPLLLYGTQIYVQWLDASAMSRETLIMPGNSSLPGLITRFAGPEPGIVLGFVVVIALLVVTWRKRPAEMDRAERASSLGILASLLASPISWTGYTILLLPVFFSLRNWTALTIASAALLTVPFAIVLQLHQLSFVYFVLFGWLYGWALLLLTSDLVKQNRRAENAQVA